MLCHEAGRQKNIGKIDRIVVNAGTIDAFRVFFYTETIHIRKDHIGVSGEGDDRSVICHVVRVDNIILIVDINTFASGFF